MTSVENGMRERHAMLEQSGRASAAAWLGHPALLAQRGELAAAVEAAVSPLARVLIDQRSVVKLACDGLGAAMVYPDGSRWFEEGEGWLLTPEEGAVAVATRDAYLAALKAAARSLRSHGAPIDPESTNHLVVLAQVLLLDVDLAQGAAAVLAGLNVAAPGGYSPDGRTVTADDTVRVREERALGDLRRRHAQRTRKVLPDRPYPQTRRRPDRTVRLDAAVAEVLAARPGTGAGAMVSYWDAGWMEPVRRAWTGAEPPDVRTLGRAVARVRATP